MSDTSTGGDAIVRVLAHAGVDTVFGVISVANFAIYDALSRHGGIRAVAARGEAGAVNMADAYARASGRLGVAITSTGPGTGNAAGALMEAQNAGTPLLHLTGHVESDALDKGRGAGHEMKGQTEMLRAISKAAFRPIGPASVPWSIQAAMEQALTTPRGVATVEVPVDYQRGLVAPIEPALLDIPRRAPAPDEVRRAAEILAGARRLVIWYGSGVLAADAAPEACALAEALGAPVITSHGGRGALPEDHPLCIGHFPSSPPVLGLFQDADVLLAVGTRLRGIETNNWRITLPPTIVQVDADPLGIGRGYPAAAAVVGDAKLALAALRAALPANVKPGADGAATAAAIRAEACDAVRVTLGPYERILDDLRAVLPRDALRVRDVTVHAGTWGNRVLEVYEPHTSIHPGGAGIGQGLAMAIGGKIACPDRATVLLVGDGGFMVNVGELATAVQEQVGIVILLFNDGGYGILRNVQERAWGDRRLAVDLHNPDFVKMAAAFGAWSQRVSSAAAFRGTLEAALAARGPALVELDMAAIGPPAKPYTGPAGASAALLAGRGQAT